MGDPLLTSVAVVVGVVVVVLLALFVLWRMMWRVAEPNEALVISGLHQGSPNGVGESLGFKIVTGKGTLVLPASRWCAGCHSTCVRPTCRSIV